MTRPGPKIPGANISELAEQATGQVFGPGNNLNDPAKHWSLKSEDLKSIGDIAINDLFFNFLNLENTDAWKVYPYQFEVHNGDTALSTLTMPLGPQSISISTPAAVATTVTMRGITEEHNAAPLRQIVITGTTGIMEDSRVEPAQSGPESALEYAFANTLQAVDRVVTTARSIETSVNKILAGGKSVRETTSPIASATELQTNANNAYTVVHNMTRFFDRYLAAKKQGATKMFLAFYMNKDQQYYDCTLNNYSIRKVAGSLEYQYTITLTAWRRRADRVGRPNGQDGRAGATNRAGLSGDLQGNPFTEITATLGKGITLLNQTAGIFRGVSQDFNTVVLAPMKKVNLLAKTITNLSGGAATASLRASLSDFSDRVLRAARNPFLDLFLSKLGSGENQEEIEKVKATIKINRNVHSNGGSLGFNPFDRNGWVNDIFVNESVRRENNTVAADSPQNSVETSDPLEEIFKNPQEYAEVFQLFDVDELELSENIQALIDAEREEALSLTADDIRNIKTDYDNFVSYYSEILGGGNESYNRINGLGTPAQSVKTLSVEDINTLGILNEMSMSLDSIAVFLDEVAADQTPENDYAEFFAQQSRTAGIDFAESASKFYVPFEFGASLERMAVKYLGEADRWVEIAALNALKAPYVDEVGFLVNFISNGAGNSFSVADATNLFIGQVIEISSDTQRPEPRSIRSIDVVSSVEVFITVDGNEDLAKFNVNDNAKIRAFLPNTVNSNQIIAIPSTVPINIPGSIRLNPDKEDLDLITLTAKADFQLTWNKQNSADIAFTASDIKIARGMHNLQQAATIKVLTPQGDLLHDPEFGNPVQVGSNVADVDVKNTLAQLSNMYNADPRFQSVIAGRVNLSTNALIVDMVLGVNNSQAYLPFTAAIPIKG